MMVWNEYHTPLRDIDKKPLIVGDREALPAKRGRLRLNAQSPWSNVYCRPSCLDRSRQVKISQRIFSQTSREALFGYLSAVKSRNHSVWFLETPVPLRRSLPAILTAAILLALVLNGCSRITTIQDIQKHPHRWFSTVQLQGTVGDRVPLVGAEVYELKDATGKIWVLTREALPFPLRNNRSLKTGQQVKIEGKIQIEEITIEGQTAQEVYIEQQHLIDPKP